MQVTLKFSYKRQAKKFLTFDYRAVALIFQEIDIVYISKKIAQTIGDREDAIEIAIGDHF